MYIHISPFRNWKEKTIGQPRCFLSRWAQNVGRFTKAIAAVQRNIVFRRYVAPLYGSRRIDLYGRLWRLRFNVQVRRSMQYEMVRSALRWGENLSVVPRVQLKHILVGREYGYVLDKYPHTCTCSVMYISMCELHGVTHAYVGSRILLSPRLEKSYMR